MKPLPLALAVLALAPLSTSLRAAPLVAPAPVSVGLPVHLAAIGDDPAAKPRRGGGKHHGKAAAETTAGTPELRSGETAESAQKAYQKKYGF